MRASVFGPLTYKSFPYFMLRVGIILIGFAVSVLLRVAIPMSDASETGGFWSDFAYGALLMLTFVPVLLALAYGGRLIRLLWTVVPERETAD